MCRASELGELFLGRMREILPRVGERARGRHVETAEDVEERGLAASGRPEQDDQFAPPEIEVHTAKRLHLDLAHPVRLHEPAGLDGDGGRCVGYGGHRPTYSDGVRVARSQTPSCVAPPETKKTRTRAGRSSCTTVHSGHLSDREPRRWLSPEPYLSSSGSGGRGSVNHEAGTCVSGRRTAAGDLAGTTAAESEGAAPGSRCGRAAPWRAVWAMAPHAEVSARPEGSSSGKYSGASSVPWTESEPSSAAVRRSG